MVIFFFKQIFNVECASVGILLSVRTHMNYKQTKLFGNYNFRGKKGSSDHNKCNIKLNNTMLANRISNGIEEKFNDLRLAELGWFGCLNPHSYE